MSNPGLVLRKGAVAAVSANLGLEQKFAVLMRAAQLGDGNAYAQLLRALVPLTKEIVRHRYRFLQSRDIDELVQDILLSVHLARATYDPSRPFLPWVMAIARDRMAGSALAIPHEIASEPPPADEVNMFRKEYGDTHAFAKAMNYLRRTCRVIVRSMLGTMNCW
jgi:hypothetical protein